MQLNLIRETTRGVARCGTMTIACVSPCCHLPSASLLQMRDPPYALHPFLRTWHNIQFSYVICVCCLSLSMHFISDIYRYLFRHFDFVLHATRLCVENCQSVSMQQNRLFPLFFLVISFRNIRACYHAPGSSFHAGGGDSSQLPRLMLFDTFCRRHHMPFNK